MTMIVTFRPHRSYMSNAFTCSRDAWNHRAPFQRHLSFNRDPISAVFLQAREKRGYFLTDQGVRRACLKRFQGEPMAFCYVPGEIELQGYLQILSRQVPLVLFKTR